MFTKIPIKFWGKKEILYYSDETDYYDGKEIGSVDLSVLYKRWPYEQATLFENKEFWYLLKFFFIASKFHPLNPMGISSVCAGIPSDLKMKCECGKLLDEMYWLKGYYEHHPMLKSIGQDPPVHEYFLRISKQCEDCGRIILIYRTKEGIYIPLLLFVGFLIPEKKYSLEDIEFMMIWNLVVDYGLITDMEQVSLEYSEDIMKYMTLLKSHPSLDPEMKKEIQKQFFDKIWPCFPEQFEKNEQKYVRKSNKFRLINIIEKEGYHPFGFHPYVFFSEDNSSIFSSYKDNSLVQVDVTKGEVINVLVPTDEEIGPDHFRNSALFSVSYDRTYCAIWNIGTNPPKIINIQSREIVWKMPDDIECLHLLFSSDNRYIFTESDSGILTIWDFPKRQKLRDVFAGERICAISPDNKYIIGANWEDYDMVICKFEDGEIVQELSGHEDHAEYIAFTPDERKVVSVSNDNTIKIWDIETAKIINNFVIYDPEKRNDDNYITAGILSPDGRYVCVPTDDSLKIYDIIENRFFQKLSFMDVVYNTGNAFFSLCFSKDGNALAMSEGKRIYVWKKRNQNT